MPEPDLAYGMLGAASDDPFTRAALRMRESARPSRGRAVGPLTEGILDLVNPIDPINLGLMAAGGPVGSMLGRVGLRALPPALGFLAGLTDEAQGGTGKVVKAAPGLAKKLLNALIVKPSGEAVEGARYGARSREALEEIEGMPKGAGPLDLSGNLRMDVPQVQLPRYEGKGGKTSPRVESALANPEVIAGVKKSMREGIKMGAEKWYLNDPIYQAWVRELGPDEGPREFARFMDYVAATSPRSDVPTNIRNASYYYTMGGRELPEKLPYPYGHIAQTLHRSNVEGLQAAERSAGSVGAQFAPEWGGWDIYKNPKPVSFSQALQGNLLAVPADTHAMRNISMRTKDPAWLQTSISELVKPGAAPSEFQREFGELRPGKKGLSVIYRPQQLVESGRMSMPEALDVPPFWVAKPTEREYGPIEGFYGGLARQLKLAPAEGQSAAWSGAGKLTGLGTVPDLTFPEMFNNRVLYTAMMRGENPQDTLRMLIRKQKPLLSLGAGAPLAPRLLELAGPQEGETDAGIR